MRSAYLAVAIAALMATGCSGGGNSASSTAGMTISGTIATGTVTMMSVGPKSADQMKSENEGTFTVSNYGVRCVTLASNPVAGEGQCDTSGKFNLSLASATNVPIGCFVISGSGSSANVVATLAFQGTSTDINGNSSRAGSYVAGSGTQGVQLGAVTLDLNKGLAVVPTTQIQTTGGTSGGGTLSGTFANMTGAWTIHALGSVPPGYTTAGSGNDGPTDGEIVYLNYYSALNGSEAHHGLSIWNSLSDFTSCAGEGQTLPVGWTLNPNTAPNNKLTTALNVTTTIPSPTGIQISCQGGSFAGLAASACAGATSSNQWTSTHTCSEILASPYASSNSWLSTSCPANNSSCTLTSNHWGQTPIQAAFLCTLNNIRQGSGGSCPGEVNIDWGNLWSSANTSAISSVGYSGSAWTGLPAASTSTDSVSYFNGAIRFQKTPRNRFLFGELYQNGNVGSLTDHHDYTANACTTAYGSDRSCPSANMVVCHVSENNKLTITQTDANNANVELVQVSTVSPTDDSACSSDAFLSDKLSQTKFMFTLSK